MDFLIVTQLCVPGISALGCGVLFLQWVLDSVGSSFVQFRSSAK
jgi:hypothetical protein